jgi:hypothetical protein
LIPSLQILLKIQHILNILVVNIDNSPLFLDDLVDLVGEEVGLGGGVLIV